MWGKFYRTRIRIGHASVYHARRCVVCKCLYEHRYADNIDARYGAIAPDQPQGTIEELE